MKKYLNYTMILLLSAKLISCNDFLEVETVGRVVIPSLFSDMDGMRAAKAGMYSNMYNYYSSEFYEYPEVAGNMVDIRDMQSLPIMSYPYNFTTDPEQEAGAVGYIWRKIYVALANTNNILQYQPSLLKSFPANKDELNQIKGEALFMRALCHFDLCRVYAQPYNYTPDASHPGVPVLRVTPGPDDNVKRASVKEVYDFVKSDLLEAEQLLTNADATDAYHVSLKAVQGLLCRVYLYSGDWTNAIVYATKVIDTSSLATGDDYLAMYNNLIEGKEAIFRLNGNLKSKSLGQFYAPANPVAIAADTLLKLYDDPTDLRLQLFSPLKTNAAKFATRKFAISVSYTTLEERYDPMVLRVSEMYLNRAEAYLNANMPDKALADLKVIIARALNKAVADVALTTTDKVQLSALLKKERARELCFEGHNFFDIVRRGDNLVRGATTPSTVKFMAYPNDYFVLPIPQAELDANTNMTGNPTVNK